jgi:hypothetical protein
VAAAISLPAGANTSAGDKATKLATCLRSHGAADAPSGADPLALKRWLATHADSSAVTACNPESAGPTELISCLRAHGLNPPSNLFQLKPWMLRQSGTSAGKATLAACHVAFDAPQAGGGAGAKAKKAAAALRACGGDVAKQP